MLVSRVMAVGLGAQPAIVALDGLRPALRVRGIRRAGRPSRATRRDLRLPAARGGQGILRQRCSNHQTVSFLHPGKGGRERCDLFAEGMPFAS